ncbi:MAG: asparagine synthase (glutamine-hydrolyzing) [Deltaproteobacteria bacterium]|nr:asparagine synthase (glutamine-hydrolyzing) [Deltaproteobacteria bacterium]
MCGIVGFSGNFDQALLEHMNAAQTHRGPDDFGIWFDESKSVGMAHRRLSIIDLSHDAGQPMSNVQETITIVFNGEIYNYRELRKELQAKGYAFKNKSDTEVLIHLYDEFGHEMLNKLNGIFAFAIWDRLKEELFIARDGHGVKPLYYVQNNSGFLFASELKAILNDPGIDKALNHQAIHYYLSYLWCPAPHTMLKSVYKLEPGYALVVKGEKIQKKWCFYDLPYGQEVFHSSESEIAVNLAEKIRGAVQRQMVSDVPVGSFLSGGLDSSAVVAFARQMNPDQKLDCFTIGFENSAGKFEGFTEDLPYAQKVAKYLGINLHTITVGSEMVNRIEEMIYFLDEPQADPAPLNALFISELAREHGIKVLLSGAGGDDIFSGYRRHYALLLEKYWSWLPGAGRKALRAFSDRLPKNNSIGRRVGKAFRYADCSNEKRLISYFLWIDENIQRSLYTDDLRNALADTSGIDPLRQTLSRIPEEKNPLNRMLYLEAKHFLADHNLNYTDKMGMAAGVEVRVPLLDKELIDFATRIPPHLKQKGRIGKYILKKAMEPYLPREVIYRPKSGFGAPLRQWLHGELREVVMEMLGERSLKARGLFDPRAVARLVEDDYNGRIDAGYTIFSLMCIEWWQRIFLDGN